MKNILTVLLIMVPVIMFGLLEKPVEMGISLLAGFVCAALINLDRFNSFKAGELEANIRHAEEVIDEANATIDQLKKMTEPLMNYLLAHIVRGDRIIGVNASDKEALYISLKENSRQFDLESQYNQELLEEAKYKVIETYLFEIELKSEVAVNDWNKAEPIRDFIRKYEYKKNDYPPVSALREFFVNHRDLYNDSVEDSIKEYERVLNVYC